MKYYSYLLIVLISMACGVSADKKAESVTDPLLLKKAIEQGNRISSNAQQALGSNLMKQIKSNGAAEAVEFCNLAAYPILDTLKTGLNIRVKRAAIKARNPNDLPTDLEKSIIEDYERAMANKQPLEPVVYALDKDMVLYASPIKTKNDMCLKCHGSELDQIDEATLSVIDRLYPDDRATGHVIGDIRGIWSIRFQKDELMRFEPDKNMALNGLQLLKQNCYSCHAPQSKSHDDIIAPPMEAVKRMYNRRYASKEAFKSAMISFIEEPTNDNAIMKGAIKRFGLMPKFPLSPEVIASITNYIYEKELEQPEWFEGHYQEMHGNN